MRTQETKNDNVKKFLWRDKVKSSTLHMSVYMRLLHPSPHPGKLVKWQTDSAGQGGGWDFAFLSFPGDVDAAGTKTILSSKGGEERDMLWNEKVEKREEGIKAISKGET